MGRFINVLVLYLMISCFHTEYNKIIFGAVSLRRSTSVCIPKKGGTITKNKKNTFFVSSYFQFYNKRRDFNNSNRQFKRLHFRNNISQKDGTTYVHSQNKNGQFFMKQNDVNKKKLSTKRNICRSERLESLSMHSTSIIPDNDDFQIGTSQ